MGDAEDPANEPAEPVSDLVLVHGWGMNPGVWETLPKNRMAGPRRHAIALPGHGGAPLPPSSAGGPGGVQAWADACLGSAPERAIWLGWSLGGLVALAAALRQPERVQGLILMTATPRFVWAPDWPPAMRAETLDRFHEGLAADPAGTLSRFLALQVRGGDEARETLRGLRRGLASRPTPDPAALQLGLELLRGEDLRPVLARLGVPSLWLFGSHDTLVPAAAARWIRALLPWARTRVVEGAAHAPFLSHPDATWALVEAFLAEFRSASPASLGSEGANPGRGPGSNRHVSGPAA
jgi:pimeloyl-[acyl-carrier protein] methyl ester esterase